MISYLDCYPCLARHALEAARQVTEDESIHREVLNRVLAILPGFPRGATPVRMAAEVHAIIRELLGVDDPYAAQKREYNEKALARLPQLRKIIEGSSDRLESAVRIAIAGNIIDFGAVSGEIDVDASLRDSLEKPLGLNDYPRLREDIISSQKMVYVGDNTGEIAFDRLLVEEIQRLSKGEITFVVRGRPILNDATLEDARIVGLTDLVPVIPAGGDAPGCELDRAPEVKALFHEADLILAKGQGNFEALSREPYPIYFLLKVKCGLIARELGGKQGMSAVIRSQAADP
jgi:uncharacterized protein with ATP-grasp and redox domains